MTPGSPDGDEGGLVSKAALRAQMRALRRSISDADGPRRSALICARLLTVVAEQLEAEPPPIWRRGVVMVFTPIRGEPRLDDLVDWCHSADLATVVPEDGPDPARVDVVVVPGLAFTADGHRLGQGGGWYDRFLVRLPERVLTVGVGFAEQLVDALPVEPHDVPLDLVVTDADVSPDRDGRSATLRP